MERRTAALRASRSSRSPRAVRSCRFAGWLWRTLGFLVLSGLISEAVSLSNVVLFALIEAL
jgi:hypothetical protein